MQRAARCIAGSSRSANAKPVKLDKSLVPFATTVWDFINRAMPQTKPGTLTRTRSMP